MIAVLREPCCSIVHSLFVQFSGGRLHDDNVEFIKSGHQHRLAILQDRQYRNILIHIIQYRIQTTAAQIQYLYACHIFFQNLYCRLALRQVIFGVAGDSGMPQDIVQTYRQAVLLVRDTFFLDCHDLVPADTTACLALLNDCPSAIP